MNDQDRCPICDTTARKIGDADFGNRIQWECGRCGTYWLFGSGRAPLRNSNAEGRAKISGYVYDQNKSDSEPELTSDLLERILARPLPSVGERAERLLIEAVRSHKKLGDRFDIFRDWWVAATYSQDISELEFLVRVLSKQRFIELPTLGGCEISLEGYIEADRISRKATQSDKCFVAMWFDASLVPAYERGLALGIKRAGYDPVVMNRVEHVNRIDDEIIARIKTSSLVVADFTGHRGGVYFEAGFALGLSLPVIWTCRKDDMEHLHFDIRQYNTIDWDDYDYMDLASRLQHRIEATVGKGPRSSTRVDHG